MRCHRKIMAHLESASPTHPAMEKAHPIGSASNSSIRNQLNDPGTSPKSLARRVGDVDAVLQREVEQLLGVCHRVADETEDDHVLPGDVAARELLAVILERLLVNGAWLYHDAVLRRICADGRGPLATMGSAKPFRCAVPEMALRQASTRGVVQTPRKLAHQSRSSDSHPSAACPSGCPFARPVAARASFAPHAPRVL